MSRVRFLKYWGWAEYPDKDGRILFVAGLYVPMNLITCDEGSVEAPIVRRKSKRKPHELR